MSSADLIGAFGEDDVMRLTGVSVGQLKAWDRAGFLVPSFRSGDAHQPYSRIYSFRDIVALRVLNSLRNEHRVSLQHLRKVSRKLAGLGNDRWTSTTLYVLGRKVVFDDPTTLERREVVSGQRVLAIPLKVAASDMRQAIQDLNRRSDEVLGHVVTGRFVQSNQPVFEGTRIPVSAIMSYLDRGYEVAAILEDYPQLRPEDIEAARRQINAAA